MSTFINCLWFLEGAEDAARWYVSLFPNSRITQTQIVDPLLAKESGQKEGGVMWVNFSLDGQGFTAINGGEQPWAKQSGFISFIINCKNQAEIDHYWNAFSDGGEPMQCGWIKDKFGIVWQVVPENLDAMMSDPVHGKAATEAMFQMKKIVIADMENAGR